MIFNYTRHALQRMAERHIQTHEVEDVIQNGTIIRDYPADKPYPSTLILGYLQNRPLHVVYSEIEAAHEPRYIIVTVYEPDPDEWDDSFMQRRGAR